MEISALHPATSVVQHMVAAGFKCKDLLAFTRRSTVILVDDDIGEGVLKVFFGSDHVLDAMDETDRSSAYGFYWYASKSEEERTFEAEAVMAEIAITKALSGSRGWPIVYGAGDTGSFRYLKLARIPGEKFTWPKLGSVEVLQRLRWLISVGDALDSLHQKGFVHRDIYHENILVSDDTVTVIDLGNARSVGHASGPQIRQPEVHWAPEYMVDYRSAGPPADIFGLGVLLHRVLTLDIPRPWSGDILERRSTPELRNLVLSCLAVDPSIRPTAREVSTSISNSLPQFAARFELQ